MDWREMNNVSLIDFRIVHFLFRWGLLSCTYFPCSYPVCMCMYACAHEFMLTLRYKTCVPKTGQLRAYALFIDTFDHLLSRPVFFYLSLALCTNNTCIFFPFYSLFLLWIKSKEFQTKISSFFMAANSHKP